MSTILQPPRSFQLALTITLPEDPRTDADITAMLFTGISLSLAVTMCRPTIALAKLPYTPVMDS